MKPIKLNTLRLKNFKGIKSFTLDATGQDVSIYGDNATGKSSLMDAFFWLLFDKDSHNRADFDIKTIEAGATKHGLDHEVEADLYVDGQSVRLKKVFSEKWTKKRGAAKKEFTGHTTAYFINDVPAKKADYTAKIKKIIDEETFRLLTDPRYFNTALHWQKRREILLSACGDISDQDVIASSSELKKLPEILGDRTLDDHRKMIGARRKEVNKELEKLPVRIDEVTQGMSYFLPDISEIDPGQIRKNIEHHKSEKADAEAEITRLESGGQAAELKKQLSEVEYKIQEEKNRFASDKAQKLNAQRVELNQAKTDANRLEHEIGANQTRIAEAEKEIQALEARAGDLRKQWHEVNSRQFSADDTCPTCGQAMPPEIIDQSRAKFNQQKAAELAEITKKGKTAKAETEQWQEKIKAWKDQINSALEKINDLQDFQEKAEAKIKEIESTGLAETGLESQKAELEKQIEQISAGDNSEALAKAREKIAVNEKQIEALNNSLARLDQHKQAQARIEELKAQEKKLAAEYEDIESQIYMTEQFVRAKVNMLEEKINSRFAAARFKLFEEQINGGLEETCIALINGVPYHSANNAAQLNVGLDIINALSDYYGFTAPIWIDNAEAVTNLAETESQMVKLVVSEDHPELTIIKEESCQNRKAS
jgi:chromosome segregation ATPase